MKIGVFDSGIGGVTVLNELTRSLPHHEFIYFGDTAHVPYGPKNPDLIQALSKSAAERIKAHQLDALVIACNTVSCLALSEFQSTLKIPVLSIIDAGIHAIEEQISSNRPVLILGTIATIQNKIFSRLLNQAHPKVTVIEQACTGLVPMIEKGWTNHPQLEETLTKHLTPHFSRDPGVALLACTHFPWIRAIFQKLLPKWEVIDSAPAVVKQVYDRFKLPSPMLTTAEPKIQWYFSDPDSVPLALLKLEPGTIGRF